MQPYISQKAHKISGDVFAPGDKSISHRSLLLSSMAIGKSSIQGLLESEDVLHLVEALRMLGVHIHKNTSQQTYEVQGVGLYGFREPSFPLDMGNSGTACRLLMGALSTLDIKSFFTGDASLSSRPMKRILQPLSEMGVRFVAREEGKLPLVIVGTSDALPISYELPVPSAQVKSAILLAALRAYGRSDVIETFGIRDHTENMLSYMGVEVTRKTLPNGRYQISLQGPAELSACDLSVAGDPSSAAFLTAAALLVPGSSLIIRNICFNPTRIGFYQIVEKMGANIEILNETTICNERVVDIHVSHSPLKAVNVTEDIAPTMIDEFPILAVLASQAEGASHMAGLAELRVKESNRFQAIIDGLRKCGVEVEENKDAFTIFGQPKDIRCQETITTHGDHRIAMSFLVMGLCAPQGVCVDDISSIQTSFPNFMALMKQVGADIKVK